MVNPIMLRTMPAIGNNGTTGHIAMRIRLNTPPSIIVTVPAINRINLERKPTMRDINLSIIKRNFTSRDEELDADSADIWRKGLKRVRTSEPMEKKSIILERAVRILLIKTCQPLEYHQKNILVITINIL